MSEGPHEQDHSTADCERRRDGDGRGIVPGGAAAPSGTGPPGSDADPAAGGPVYPGSEQLGGERPLAILRRLADGDPLEIHAACEVRMVRRALLLDLPRLTLRAMARAAARAPAYRGHPELDAWLSARIDEAIGDLLREDREEERRGAPLEEPWDERYAFLSEAMGVEPALARRLCNLLNDLEDRPRHAFFHLIVLKKSIQRYVAEGHGPPDRVRESLRTALATLSNRKPTGRDPGPEGTV